MASTATVVRDLREKSSHVFSNAKQRIAEQTREIAGRVDKKAHQKPWLFVGAGALVTGVLGFFLGKKISK